MDPFEIALDAQFHAPGSTEATYVAASGLSPAEPIRVIRSQPDEIVQFGDTPVVQGSELFLIRRSDVAQPKKGDRLNISAGSFELRGEAMLDVEGLTWRMGAIEA